MALRNLPGIRGLFSLFQHALTSATSRNRVKLSAAVHLFLTDFKHIVNQLHTCPARFRELVPTPPTFIGACDASGHGMGGVWFPPSPFPPILWRAFFPPPPQILTNYSQTTTPPAP